MRFQIMIAMLLSAFFVFTEEVQSAPAKGSTPDQYTLIEMGKACMSLCESRFIKPSTQLTSCIVGCIDPDRCTKSAEKVGANKTKQGCEAAGKFWSILK